MTMRDIESLASRFLPNAITWSKGVWGSVKSGEIWKLLNIWWRANSGFALLSLVLALLLYFRIRENINYNGSRSIPVEVQVVGGESSMSVAVEPSVIDVFVRGAENDVRKFEMSDLPIRLRIPADKVDNSADGVTITIKARRDIPGLRELGLVPTGISSDKVRVTYDLPADVEFFIDPPKHVGTPYHGEVKGVQFTPQSVTLHGGRKILSSLRERDVVRPQLPVIDVENAARGFKKQYDIILPEPLGKVATLSPVTSVTVSVEIVRLERTTTFERVPVRISMPPGVVLPRGCRLLPLHVSANVCGYDPAIASLSNDMVTAYAYVPSASTLDLSPGATNTLQVKLEVPHDKEIWTVEPKPSAVKLIMPAPPPLPTPPATNDVTPVFSALSAENQFTNAPVAMPSATAGITQSTSNDKTEAKDLIENGKPKEHE